MKTITTIAMGIILLSCISAIEMRADENYTIEFPNTNPVQVEFSKNSSNMEGFNWLKDGTTIYYWIDLSFAADNFTVRWFNSEEVFVDNRHRGGSGGDSYTKPIEVDNETDNNITGTSSIPEENEEEESKSFFSSITGAVIGSRIGKSILFIVGIFLIGGIAYFIVKRFKS